MRKKQAVAGTEFYSLFTAIITGFYWVHDAQVEPHVKPLQTRSESTGALSRLNLQNTALPVGPQFIYSSTLPCFHPVIFTGGPPCA